MEEINSRGDDEERVFAIGNALHVEEHLSELMSQQPEKAKDLSKELDDIRMNRQNLVNLWANGRANPSFWCATKHKVIEEVHLREMLNNASRYSPSEVEDISKILAETVKQRKSLASKFLNGGGNPDGKCPRCESDLGKEAVEKIEEFTKGLNTTFDNKNINTKNTKQQNYKGGSNKMNMTELGLINGGNFAGKGLIILSDYVDEKFTLGQPWYKRASTYIDVLGGLGLQVAAWKWVKNSNLQLVMAVTGSHLTTRIVDIAKAELTSGSGYRVRSSQLLPLPHRVEQTPQAPGERVAIF